MFFQINLLTLQDALAEVVRTTLREELEALGFVGPRLLPPAAGEAEATSSRNQEFPLVSPPPPLPRR